MDKELNPFLDKLLVFEKELADTMTLSIFHSKQSIEIFGLIIDLKRAIENLPDTNDLYY